MGRFNPDILPLDFTGPVAAFTAFTCPIAKDPAA